MITDLRQLVVLVQSRKSSGWVGQLMLCAFFQSAVDSRQSAGQSAVDSHQSSAFVW